MPMNPRTHARGAPPDFTLPAPNPNPSRMTNALWWLVCMRNMLEPGNGVNGGTYAAKPGYHNAGENLPDHGPGNTRTDHSIRRMPDRSGLWWERYCSAHDWTFRDAQSGNYATITKYTRRLINAMRDPDDLRPDDVYAYTLGQTDGDAAVEGYSEYSDGDVTSGDSTHLWHRHDSFRRNIIGNYGAMWKALTIDMGWTYAEWQRSVSASPDNDKGDDMPLSGDDKNFIIDAVWNYRGGGLQGATNTLDALTDTQNIQRALTDLTAYVIGQGSLDVNALAAALVTPLAAALNDAIEAGPLTAEDVEAALRNVFRTAGTAPPPSQPMRG